MTEAELLKIVDAYREHVLNEDEGDAEFRERMLLGLCRDIERESRSSALKAIYPVFDVLERLYDSGHYTDKQDGRWILFDKGGEGVASGKTFRDLCVNIVLAGL